tara:strand:- start:81 stop:809 length:729 start_codon:yes stop_codon:yes gene_type:complete
MKREQKRGQVAILLILAVVIVAGVLLVYFLGVKSSQSSIDLNKIDPEFRPVYQNLVSCLEEISKDAVIITGVQGGKIEPDNFLETNFGKVSYGLRDGRNVLIKKNDLENEISSYVDDNIEFCVESGLAEFKDFNSKTEIKENEVKINPKFQLSISSGNKSIVFEQYPEISLSVRLGYVLDTANKIVEKQIETKDQISLTYLSQFDLDIVFDYLNEDLLFIIHDEESKINDIEYSFIFIAEIK